MTVNYGPLGSSLRDLPRLRSHRRRRASSWDRTGGNADFVTIEPGQTVLLADIIGAGSVNHIWVTAADMNGGDPGNADPDFLRKLVLRITWDDSATPSVLAPLGDFFGMGHGLTRNFVSAPLQMSPQDGRGFNSWFHMPFASRARFEVTSACLSSSIRFYFYIDYDEFDELEPGLGRFHACWNVREADVDAGRAIDAAMPNPDFLFGGVNTTGEDNYTILQATGRGHYVGCVLNVLNQRQTPLWNWYGEGDDMIFIDGEPFPPSLHGTGTEDYFNTAWCPSEAYHAPYHGITLPGGHNWSGRISLYRFHIEDPVSFNTSIRVSIEAGHANRRYDQLSSVAYWYQELPCAPLAEPTVPVA